MRRRSWASYVPLSGPAGGEAQAVAVGIVALVGNQGPVLVDGGEAAGSLSRYGMRDPTPGCLPPRDRVGSRSSDPRKALPPKLGRRICCGG